MFRSIKPLWKVLRHESHYWFREDTLREVEIVLQNMLVRMVGDGAIGTAKDVNSKDIVEEFFEEELLEEVLRS